MYTFSLSSFKIQCVEIMWPTSLEYQLLGPLMKNLPTSGLEEGTLRKYMVTRE